MNEAKVLVALAATLASSACYTVTPHENFKSIIGASVGKGMDDPSAFTRRYPEALIGSHTLQNGNIELEYLLRRSCRHFYEIDRATKIIIAFRFEGTIQDCEIQP